MSRRIHNGGMEETDNRPRRKPYRIRSERTWTLVRERYLAGESAPRLSEVFDVSVPAIRARAGRKGWTKRALAEATPVEPADARLVEAVAEHRDGDLTATDAARLALGEAVKLLREGRMTLAGEAARVADVMARAAGRLDGAAAGDPGEPDEAAFEAVRRKVLGEDWDGGPSPAASSPVLQDGEQTV